MTEVEAAATRTIHHHPVCRGYAPPGPPDCGLQSRLLQVQAQALVYCSFSVRVLVGAEFYHVVLLCVQDSVCNFQSAFRVVRTLFSPNVFLLLFSAWFGLSPIPASYIS